MAFDFKKEDAAKYGREVYRAFRCKGNHRWDTCVFANESGGYAAVFRHSFRKKIIEDGKEFRRNVIDDETVVAAPDAYRGEVVRAYVVARAGADLTPDSLQAHCQGNLAKYKWPASIDLVAELPKTAVGKIDKPAIRRFDSAVQTA